MPTDEPNNRLFIHESEIKEDISKQNLVLTRKIINMWIIDVILRETP